MSEVVTGLDMSRIRPLILKENHLLGMGFPEGYLFFRILRKEVLPYLYDERDSLAADEYNIESEWGIAARTITNAFVIPNSRGHIVQLFRGLAPSAYRTYLGSPYTTPQYHLDRVARTQQSQFGYLDGFMSPLNYPSPESETWIPFRHEIGFAEWNPLSDTIYPLLKFIVVRYEIALIRDVTLIMRILAMQAKCRFATVGGLSKFDYHYREFYEIDPIVLTDTQGDVAKKVVIGKES